MTEFEEYTFGMKYNIKHAPERMDACIEAIEEQLMWLKRVRADYETEDMDKKGCVIQRFIEELTRPVIGNQHITSLTMAYASAAAMGAIKGYQDYTNK